jgi:hypothetical protein
MGKDGKRNTPHSCAGRAISTLVLARHRLGSHKNLLSDIFFANYA